MLYQREKASGVPVSPATDEALKKISTYLGIIGNLFVEAKEKRKKLKLRVPRRIEWIFQLAGFREMLEIEVVD